MPCIPELPLNGSPRNSKLTSSIQCRPRHTCLAYSSCPRMSAARKHKVYIFHVLCTHTTSLLRICVCYTQDRNAKQQAKVLQVWRKHAMQKTCYSAGYMCFVCLYMPQTDLVSAKAAKYNCYYVCPVCQAPLRCFGSTSHAA